MQEHFDKTGSERLKYTMSTSQVIIDDPIYEHK